MLTQEQIGRRVRAAREELRLSQTALGEQFGRTHAAISDIERGKTKVGIPDLIRLAAILRKPLAYFTAEEGMPAALYRRGDQELPRDEEHRLARILEEFKAHARTVARERGETGEM